MPSRRAPEFIVSLAALLSLAGVGSAAFADTIVKGKVVDPTTESGIIGAKLKLRRGATELALTNTDAEGYFELVFPFEVVQEQRTLVLSVERDNYSPNSTNIIVTAGRPDSSAYQIELTPVAIAHCRRSTPHVVIVGYFRNPGGSQDVSDLPGILVTGLSSNLLPELQKRHLPEDFQPVFAECTEARPKSQSDLDNFARALGADVFIFGDVLETGPAYRIRTYVGDRYNVFDPPKTVVNDNVAVTDPAAAELDKETHAYMLVALAQGYAQQERFAECVDVCVAAEQVLGDAASPIVAQREFCQERTANSGLLP